MENQKTEFPALPLEKWEQSKITLHLWMQIVGKAKLDLMPWKNHWWHITFHLCPQGITSGPIPHKLGNFEFLFDFQNHAFKIITSWGKETSFPLKDGLAVAAFHQKFFEALNSLGIEVQIIAEPYDHPCKEPFAECKTYHNYDREYIGRFWRVLMTVDNIFKTFSGRFYGKVSPSQIYWHHMDLAITRFSGKEGPAIAEDSGIADKEAYSHEVISAGFWAGDEEVRGAAFYSYTYPSPDGLDKETIMPAAANWVNANGSPMAVLMYDDLIKGEDPKKDLMNFLESTYQAGAKLAGWPTDLTRDVKMSKV